MNFQELTSPIEQLAGIIGSSDIVTTFNIYINEIILFLKSLFTWLVPPEVVSFLKAYLIFIPIGIIGIWRWGMWLFKKIVGSLFYRIPTGKFKGKISIVTPVYNEDPYIFAKALKSWWHNNVDEIVAVIDYTDKRSIRVFELFSCKYPEIKTNLLTTSIPGKRSALASGIKASSHDIVALVDSDTVWDRKIKNKLLAPFADPEVGGVAMRQDVYKPNTLANTLFKIHLDIRFLNEMPYLAAVGDALMVLSGRTAVYQKKAIIDKMSELVEETFMGQKVISGDDKRLTQLIQEEGWKTRYVKDAIVFTPGVRDIKTYMKQRLRWARNTIRSDLKTLGSSWVWKKEKPLAIYMVDRFIPPFTLMFGPAFLITALYFQHYKAILIFLVWLLISRLIKLMPHLREAPQSILILPLYIVLSYFEALGKIFAFFTMNEQGWITRWSANRLKRGLLHMLRQVPGAAIAILIPVSITYATMNIEAQRVATIQQKTAEKEAKIAEKQRIAAEKGPALAIKKAVMENKVYQSQFYPDMEATKNILIAETRDDQYGYYVVKTKDTVPRLIQLFNLPGPQAILDATTKKPVSGNFLRLGQKLAIPITEFKAPIDPQKPSRVTANPLIVTYSSLTNTIKVRGEGNKITLRRIGQVMARVNRNSVQEIAPGEWILRSNLEISKNVIFVMASNDMKSLKLQSQPGKFVWIKAEDASMLISGIEIKSWDENNKAPDINLEDGRSFITSKGSGRMDVIDSEISYLGYVGAPNRGGPFGGSYGLSWKIDSRKFRDNLLTGVAERNRIHHNFFGLYTFGATGIIFRNNDIHDNVQYGIDPHDDSNNLLIENNQVYNNGSHGIITSKRCFDNAIQNNIVYGNKLHGIMLDQQSNNNLVRNNTIEGSVDGIAIYDSYNNVMINNKVSKSSKSGVRINKNSARNYVAQNSLTEGYRGIYLYGEAKDNLILDNIVSGNEFGIAYKTLQQNDFSNNIKTGENKNDIYVLVGAENYEIK